MEAVLPKSVECDFWGEGAVLNKLFLFWGGIKILLNLAGTYTLKKISKDMCEILQDFRGMEMFKLD